MDALLDTGSPTSFIDLRTFKYLFPLQNFTKNNSSFVSVSGTTFTSCGTVKLPVSVENMCIQQNFFLIDSPISIILGIDALCALRLNLRFSPQTIQLSSDMSQKVASLQNSASPVTTTASSASKTALPVSTFSKLSEVEYIQLFNLPRDKSDALLTQLRQLLIEFRDVFSENKYDIGYSKFGYHDICTGNATPTVHKQYRLAHAHKPLADNIIDDMLKHGIIEEAQSPWNSPFILVDKQDGTKRFAVDYRSLNEVTVKDRLPMPNVDDLLDDLSGYVSFSLLDLTSGFWQIPLTDSSKPKTAFSAGTNQYQFTVMPFGLSNAPATFQRIMQTAVKNLPTTPYIDDLIIPSNSDDEQLVLLRKVFERLREGHFKLKPSKCEFMSRKIKYLGFIVEDGKLLPDPDKVCAIELFPLPQTTKDLQRFLGMCNFFSRFIFNYATISSPLTNIQNTPKAKFKTVWIQNAALYEDTFNQLKQILISNHVLHLPNFDSPFFVDVDASEVAIAGVLHQSTGPISYFSAKLKTAQKNYSTTDKEFLALYSTIMRYRVYLLGSKFTVYSDHKPLTSLVRGAPNNARQTRWQLALQEFDFEIVYKPGKDNTVADCLSRPPISPVLPAISSLTEQIKEAQVSSDEIRHCVDALIKERNPVFDGDISRSVERCQRLGIKTFSVNDYLLYHNNRLVIPQSILDEVILRYHASGHFSGNKTQEAILERFWCPKLRSSVSRIIEACGCNVMKSYGHNPRPSRFPKTSPFEVISVDIVSLPPDRHFQYLLTMVDMATKWLTAVPLTNIAADTIGDAIEKRWIYVYGPPAVFHSDQGTQFKSEINQALLQKFGISQSFSSAYHSKGNSVIERAHRTFKDRLRTMKGRWSNSIAQALYDSNRLSGAFQAVFARSGVPAGDWPTQSDFLVRTTAKTGPQDGDWIAIRDRKPPNTLSPRFIGRFRVKKRHGNSVKLSDGRQINLHDALLVGKNEE